MTGEAMIERGYVKRQDEMCRSCKAPITWWLTPAAKAAPYNRVEELTVEVVSHFATCPQSAQWKGKGKP